MNSFRFFLVFGLIFLSSGFSFSQEDENAHIHAARRAIAALHATDGYDSILPKVVMSLKHQLIQQWPNKAKEIVDILEKKSLQIARRRADLESEAGEIYRSFFSEKDLTNIERFYNSESGRKLLKSGPFLVKELQEAGEIWEAAIVRDLAESIRQDVHQFGKDSLAVQE